MKKLVYTKHGRDRMKERIGIKSKKTAEHIATLVMERGIKYEECQYKIDSNYLKSRTRGGQTAYAYNGVCYIIDIEQRSIITTYPLPKSFGQKKKDYYERGNQKKYDRKKFKSATEDLRVRCGLEDEYRFA